MQDFVDILTFVLDTAACALSDWLESYDQPTPAQEHLLHAGDAKTRAALWYAQAGLPVFPCKPDSKRPATPHGFKDATTNRDQVETWWAQNPAYNIAAPTGILFDVLDIDNPLTGWPHVSRELQTGSIPPPFLAVHTPRCFHLYLPPTHDTRNATEIYPGVDYRTRGGYVLMPPSHITKPGRPYYPSGFYRWAYTPWPDATDLTRYATTGED